MKYKMRYEYYSKAKDKKITESWGDYLGKWLWQWFITLTIKDEIRIGNTIKFRKVYFSSAKRYFERYIDEHNKDSEYFLAIESDEFGDIVHLHALVRGVTKLNKWKHGRAEILPYNKNLNARHYVVKYITSSHTDYDFRLNQESQMQD